MQKILKLFEKSPIIHTYTILDYKSSSDSEYLKAKLKLKNGDLLFFKEYTSANEHIYSYHWQKPEGSLMVRWDNSPHHKELKTFPHHKHCPDLKASYETTFGDVLKEIENILESEKL
ncbi:MAG: hypothetical protein GF317_15140 [Candidatus Lokiarchaeota archaeon]|nr:hypothetical protein [Candidatus Lokiarchaeota archaeon]MBD3200909.1 hypothetical protein [Candidatus Lokiarchaeota archaeon]